MATNETFEDVLEALRRRESTADDVVAAVSRLRHKRHAGDVAAYLLARLGDEPKVTRTLIRAAGKSRSSELHDVLADRLMDPACEDYRYELIDAIADTRARDYAAVVIPFTDAKYPDSVRTTAVYALGALRSPVSILPLVKLFQKSGKNTQLRSLVLQSLRRLLDSADKQESLEFYLATTPEKVRSEIREAFHGAA